MIETFKGNKREVPPDLPILVWRDMVLEVEQLSGLQLIGWFHPVMEFLSPAELKRIRAKALVWRHHTGEWPEDISVWWEVRLARRRGDIPHKNEFVLSGIDESGVLHCGRCEARWSADDEGSHPDRCKLCDVRWIISADERIPDDPKDDNS